MRIRPYNKETDFKYVERIWREIGWLSAGDDDDKTTLKLFLEGSNPIVGEFEGEVEGMVSTCPGEMRYLDQDLKMDVVGAVTISRVARKQGLAKEMTARAIANSALNGAKISALGMFEQGFYNRLGYGTGGYEYIHSFNPANLSINLQHRPPRRISKDDWKKAHQARLNRKRCHGSCNITNPLETRGVMNNTSNGFGLGYYNDEGELSHYIWCEADKVFHGPYWIEWMVYQTKEQFLELMALIKSLGDQVHKIGMIEPAGIQLQDLLHRPFVNKRVTKGSTYSWVQRISAYWQMRILDLEGCLEKTHLLEEVRFNLNLSDPLEHILPDDAKWKGVGGQYVITLGPASKAEPGYDENLPTLDASVGAFTRMWLGVRPATGLSVTDEIDGPDQLLADLDRVLSIVPQPKPDWDF